MRRLHRRPLSPETAAFLQTRTEAVSRAADPRGEASRLWELQGKAFREVREILRDMASGTERCMYCEDGEGTAIDHFWPKGNYPERAFDWLNYLLACSVCNSNFKRDQFPVDEQKEPLLLNPTEDDPLAHLRFTTTGHLIPRTLKGEWSIRVYGLDREALQKGRKNTWVLLQAIVILYAQAVQEGDSDWAVQLEQGAREHQYSGVLAALIWLAATEDPDVGIRPEFLAAIRHHPEILTWA